MHITCEGKAYELFEGATPQNLWNMVSGGRDPETAVLADCEGDIIDFQTPFTGDTDVKWIPLGSPLAHRAYQRSLIMLLAIAAKEVYGGEIEVAVKHALGKRFIVNSVMDMCLFKRNWMCFVIRWKKS